MENNVVIVNSQPKDSKPKIKKIVLASLGLLVLVTGVLAGTLLIQQNQDFRERASTDPCLNHDTSDLCAADTVNNCAWVQCAAGGPEGISTGSCHVAETPVTSVCSPSEGEPSVVFCQNIKVYDFSWTELTASDLKALKPGDRVYLTVTGMPETENFDKARFSVNDGAWIEVGTDHIHTGTTTEFFYLYTIPSNNSTFKVEAEVHSVTLNTWI